MQLKEKSPKFFFCYPLTLAKIPKMLRTLEAKCSGFESSHLELRRHLMDETHTSVPSAPSSPPNGRSRHRRTPPEAAASSLPPDGGAHGWTRRELHWPPCHQSPSSQNGRRKPPRNEHDAKAMLDGRARRTRSCARSSGEYRHRAGMEKGEGGAPPAPSHPSLSHGSEEIGEEGSRMKS